jgi:hypothetical protein
MHLFPRQGDREPWVNPQSYRSDKAMIRNGTIEERRAGVQLAGAGGRAGSGAGGGLEARA